MDFNTLTKDELLAKLNQKGIDATGSMTNRQLWSLMPGVGIESDSDEHLNEPKVADENGAYSYDAQDDGKSGSFQSKKDLRLKR
jgi:hypothetical protein